MFQQFVADNQTMSDLFACAPFGRAERVVDGQAEIATAFISTRQLLPRARRRRAHRAGRSAGRRQADAPPAVAVISSKYWHSRFGTDPAVVGKTVKINNVLVTIVGVIPAEFTGVQQPLADPPDVSVPLALDPQLESAPPRPRSTPPSRLSSRPTGGCRSWAG